MSHKRLGHTSEKYSTGCCCLNWMAAIDWQLHAVHHFEDLWLFTDRKASSLRNGDSPSSRREWTSQATLLVSHQIQGEKKIKKIKSPKTSALSFCFPVAFSHRHKLVLINCSGWIPYFLLPTTASSVKTDFYSSATRVDVHPLHHATQMKRSFCEKHWEDLPGLCIYN